MVEKYIIDKTDIHDLLTGKDLPLQQGKARAFCVEIAGKITNGDMIKAMFPNASVYEHNGGSTYSVNNEYNFNTTWWDAPYITESEGNE